MQEFSDVEADMRTVMLELRQQTGEWLACEILSYGEAYNLGSLIISSTYGRSEIVNIT